jgi:hypothetical protein
MAKRTPQSQANETSTASSTEAKSRARSKSGATAAAPDAADTFAARPEESDETPREEPPSPSEEDIRLRAYHRYLARGGSDGMDFEDWLEAERELKQQR